jgi:hypothetical protein
LKVTNLSDYKIKATIIRVSSGKSLVLNSIIKESAEKCIEESTEVACCAWNNNSYMPLLWPMTCIKIITSISLE